MQADLWQLFKELKQTHHTWHGVLHEIERQILQGALDEEGKKNHSKVAREVGLQRTTLIMKLKRLGLIS